MPKSDQSQRNERPLKNDRPSKGTRLTKSDLSIEMLGTSFSISAEEEPAYLEGILNNYRLALGSIQESTGLRDPLKLAILTGFLLCDKIQRIYLREVAEQEAEAHETREAEQITLNLIARINELLKSES